ncbi:protease Do [Tepidicaulis marinus]|uniref:Probable periplasmic serine endoprotease DegP-like n=2 Tax=Tepidicaulis marinus TaxID=1333998 RepID=A0A081B9W9_9HYPH|nr:protease Do [Tepidicaulis marinus]
MARLKNSAVARRQDAAPGIMRLLTALAALTAMMLALYAAPAFARGAPESFADLAEKLSPAVVNISTSQTLKLGAPGAPVPGLPEGSPFNEFFEDFLQRQPGGQAPRKVQSLGSGFVIDPDGIIITNNHVIEQADEIKVNFSDGTTLAAEVLGRDPKTDVAVLRVEPDRPLPFVKMGDSTKARVGDWVVAIGNPFGLGGTVTAGIISAINRDINAGPYDDFIQTDASINRGNSGGPLFNLEGEVIGVNTAIISPSGGSIGIGFSVPSATAMPVIEQLKEYGETRRGWLGVRIQTVTDEIAESLGMDEAKGALVAEVTPGGPAEEAGIQAGDVIIDFDGKDVPSMRDLPRIVADTKIGREVETTVLRGGDKVTLEVKVGRLEEAEAKAEGAAKPDADQSNEPTLTLGLALGELNANSRRRFNLPDDVEGVLVTSVDPAGPAAEKGIRPGDVIVEVAQEKVKSPSDVVERVKAEQEKGRRSVLLLVSTAGDLRFIAVRIEEG